MKRLSKRRSSASRWELRCSLFWLCVSACSSHAGSVPESDSKSSVVSEVESSKMESRKEAVPAVKPTAKPTSAPDKGDVDKTAKAVSRIAVRSLRWSPRQQSQSDKPVVTPTPKAYGRIDLNAHRCTNHEVHTCSDCDAGTRKGLGCRRTCAGGTGTLGRRWLLKSDPAYQYAINVAQYILQ